MAHVNDQWYHIKKSIQLLQDRFVPFGPVSRRRTLPWLWAKHKCAQKSNHLAFVQYMSSPSAYAFKVYHEESNKLSKLMKKSRWTYEQPLALKAKSQPKLFFAHVRRNQHLKKNISGFKDSAVEPIFTPPVQVELLKNFYSSIFSENDPRPTPTLPDPTVVSRCRSSQFRLCIESWSWWHSPADGTLACVFLGWSLFLTIRQFPNNGSGTYWLALGHYMPNT